MFRDFVFIFLFLVRFSQPATQTDVRGGKFKNDLRSCVAIRPAFSSLLSRYSFSKTRKLSSSIRRSSAQSGHPERAITSFGSVATYGLTKTLFAFVSTTNAPCATLEHSYFSCGGYGLTTIPDAS